MLDEFAQKSKSPTDRSQGPPHLQKERVCSCQAVYFPGLSSKASVLLVGPRLWMSVPAMSGSKHMLENTYIKGQTVRMQESEQSTIVAGHR